MSLQCNKFLGIAVLAAIFPVLAGCGQTIRGELPDPAAPISSVLTPEQAKAAAEALVRANEERQIADAVVATRRTGTTP